jgi:hypothetical protein
MKALNRFLTLSSVNLVLISVERFSPTTRVLLQPDSFLRLHEVVQLLLLILVSVLIPCGVLYTMTGELQTLKAGRGKLLGVLFVVGLYLYATGNGVHELASFLFNLYCPQPPVDTPACRSLFFDDYYFGNIVYFLGAFVFTAALILLEQHRPVARAAGRDYLVLALNALVYALAILAYAAFDRVLVGLGYAVIATLFILGVVLLGRRPPVTTPFTLYSAIAYSVGTGAALLLRFVR